MPPSESRQPGVAPPSNRRLRALADSMPALVSAVDCQFIYRFVNSSYSEWFAQSQDAIVGQSMEQLLGQEAFAIVRPRIERAFAGETVSYEATLPYKTGGPRHVLATYSPDRADDGTVIGAFVLVQDLSSRRQVETALAESERALRASGVEFEGFFGLPNVGKALADPSSGRILRVNRKLCQITGYTEEELLEQRIVDLTHPGDTDRGRQAFEAFARGDVAEYQIEKEYARKDGSAIWLRVDAALIRDESGRPLKLIAAARDITPERVGQEMLRRSEQSHRLLVALHDATRGERDPERVLREFVRLVGQHFDVNRCAYGEVDASQQDVTVMVDYHAGTPSLAGRHILAGFGAGVIQALRAGQTVVAGDVHADPRTGPSAAAYDALGIRSFLVVPLVKGARLVAVMALADTRPRQWSADDVALMELIAERTWFALDSARAEVTVREHRDVLALAMRGGRMGAWSRDLLTNRVWWSRELEEIVGLPPGGFDGSEEGFFSVVLEQDRPAVAQAVSGAIDSHTDYAVEFRFRHGSGEWRWMEGRGRAVYGADGMPVMLYGIGIDITERKRIEDELRRLNAELSDADRRKDDFIAMLAHELRNPLAPVRYAVELLRLRGTGQPDLAQARETIERQVRQMAKLLDDLMDVARVSRGKLQVHRAPIQLNDVLLMAVETSRPLLDRHQHTFTLSLPPSSPVVLGDAARLTQVFANLLNNAARYTPQQGQVQLTATSGAGVAVVRVRDTGVGLRPEQLIPIFNAFSQAHESGHSGGLGLGLALAQAIVSLHEGTIEARSDGPGRGSEFVVTVPLSSPSRVVTADAEPDATASVKRRRVLVVDDNRDAADSLVALLSVDGHEVVAAYDGRSALERAEVFAPDVVLLDIGLPDRSGYAVARRLRGGPVTTPRTIIAISGWGQPRDMQDALDAGCDAHLTKPASPDKVRQLIESAPWRPADA